jgi:hypothetical protein
MSTPTPEYEERRGALPVKKPNGAEPPPIKPLEPLDSTQPEIPKVGTTDAPGG